MQWYIQGRYTLKIYKYSKKDTLEIINDNEDILFFVLEKFQPQVKFNNAKVIANILIKLN